MTGTEWNRRYPTVITVPPYNTEGDATAAFTTKERTEIVSFWRATAEAYSMFDVDVTTEDPGTTESYGTRVCIGGSSRDWLCPTSATPCAGGVAFLGSFRNPFLQPAFAFSSTMVSAMWKAVIHEGACMRESGGGGRADRVSLLARLLGARRAVC